MHSISTLAHYSHSALHTQLCDSHHTTVTYQIELCVEERVRRCFHVDQHGQEVEHHIRQPEYHERKPQDNGCDERLVVVLGGLALRTRLVLGRVALDQ